MKNRIMLDDVLYIVKEMYNFIGVEYKRENVEHDPEWFMRHRWSEEEQALFQKWLVKHLHTKHRQRKDYAEECAGWFMHLYGFTTKKPDEEFRVRSQSCQPYDC
ncbi:MAG: hypothetical protein FIA89_11840 [Geobacter sp.]|nr:hypothetical protein [Geobacter sp.]